MLRQSRFALDGLKSAVYPAEEATGYDLEYFEMLLAEHRENTANRYGQVVRRWVKAPNVPNEGLDLYAYSLAGVHLIGVGALLARGRRAAAALEPVEEKEMV